VPPFPMARVNFCGRSGFCVVGCKADVLFFAFSQNVDENSLFRNLSDEALLEYIRAKQWHPTTTQLPRL